MSEYLDQLVEKEQAEDMMNQKQRKMSGEREGLYRRIEDP